MLVIWCKGCDEAFAAGVAGILRISRTLAGEILTKRKLALCAQFKLVSVRVCLGLAVFLILAYLPSFFEWTGCCYMIHGKVDSQFADNQKQRNYSSRHHLLKQMLSLDPLYPEFVSGPKCGIDRVFFCKV